jgi:hypothetical protein
MKQQKKDMGKEKCQHPGCERSFAKQQGLVKHLHTLHLSTCMERCEGCIWVTQYIQQQEEKRRQCKIEMEEENHAFEQQQKKWTEEVDAICQRLHSEATERMASFITMKRHVNWDVELKSLVRGVCQTTRCQ